MVRDGSSINELSSSEGEKVQVPSSPLLSHLPATAPKKVIRYEWPQKYT